MSKMENKEKIKEQLEEDLRKTRDELAIQKWGIEKTLWGMKVLVKELIQRGKEREEAKAKGDEERSKLQVLIDYLPVGVFTVKAPNGEVITVNPRGRELLGRGIDPKAKKESYSQIYAVVKEDGTPYPNDELPASLVLATGHPAEKRDIYIKRPDGSRVALKASGVPVKDATGKLLFVTVVFDDITKEKDIDKAKTEFVSLASHQLRTPLSTVNWYSEMLLSGDVGKVTVKQRKYLDEVYRGNQRMIELVNALLNVSRIELGTFVIEPKPTDIVKLSRSVVDEQKPQIDAKRIKFSSSFEKSIPFIQADPKLLRMVVQNILSNAVKYTPENGKIELLISLVDKKNIQIKISDTGYGIPKNQQDKIFTKLFRGDNVREKDTQGTGLGLYIVKSIVENSGGKIWFESHSFAAFDKATAGKEENKGTIFYVTLPLDGMKKKGGTKALS